MAGSSDELPLEVVLKHPGAKCLIRQPGSVGYDVSSCVPITVPGRGWIAVPTGVHLAIPKDHVGTITSRSGLAFHFGIYIQAGIIDPDFRGEIKVNKVVEFCVTG